MINKSLLFKLTAVLIIIVIAYIGISFYIATRLVAPYHSRIDISPNVISSNNQNIEVSGTDNVTLKGWLFNYPSDKLVILVTGAKENRTNVSYYGVLIAKELISQNYNVIMYDSRATGESGGDHITFGLKESQDITKVVEYAQSKGFKPQNIAVIGDSLGAISLLLDAKNLSDIGAIISDSSASEIRTSVEKILQKENNVPAIFNPGAFFFLKVLYGIDIDVIKPISVVQEVPNRVFLFLHGAKDSTIPVTEAKDLLSKANPKSKLVIFPNGEHVETYKSDPQMYRNVVFPFLNEELGK